MAFDLFLGFLCILSTFLHNIQVFFILFFHALSAFLLRIPCMVDALYLVFYLLRRICNDFFAFLDFFFCFLNLFQAFYPGFFFFFQHSQQAFQSFFFCFLNLFQASFFVFLFFFQPNKQIFFKGLQLFFALLLSYVQALRKILEIFFSQFKRIYAC